MRYRIDGVLHEMKAPPKRLQAAIISRLKIQSNMSISEHRIPQDGRIQTDGGRQADRLARIVLADQSRREHRHAYPGQGRTAPGLAGAGLFHGRPADLRAADRLAGRHPAGDRADRLGQDHHALFLPAFHQPARPQDHHGGGPGGIFAGGHQPGAGQRSGRADLLRPPCARSCARRPT